MNPEPIESIRRICRFLRVLLPVAILLVVAAYVIPERIYRARETAAEQNLKLQKQQTLAQLESMRLQRMPKSEQAAPPQIKMAPKAPPAVPPKPEEPKQPPALRQPDPPAPIIVNRINASAPQNRFFIGARREGATATPVPQSNQVATTISKETQPASVTNIVAQLVLPTPVPTNTTVTNVVRTNLPPRVAATTNQEPAKHTNSPADNLTQQANSYQQTTNERSPAIGIAPNLLPPLTQGVIRLAIP